MADQNISILKLGNELTVRRYQLNRLQIVKELKLPEYIAMFIIKETASEEEIYGGKTYMKDLAEKMHLSIRQTSRIVRSLKDRGLISWLHDGNGSDGTYITLTEAGRQLLEEQQNRIKQVYGKVIEQFGRENLIQMLNLMKQFETIMSSELEELEDGSDEVPEIE